MKIDLSESGVLILGASLWLSGALLNTAQNWRKSRAGIIKLSVRDHFILFFVAMFTGGVSCLTVYALTDNIFYAAVASGAAAYLGETGLESVTQGFVDVLQRAVGGRQ